MNPSRCSVTFALRLSRLRRSCGLPLISTSFWGMRFLAIQMVSCTDGKIRIIDFVTDEVVKTIDAHTGDITCVVASYDRTMFATASKDAKTRIYDMFTFEEIASFDTDRSLNSVALSPILDHVVVVGGVEARDVTTSRSQKMESLFFNIATKEEIGRVKGSFGTMNSVQFSPDGKRWE